MTSYRLTSVVCIVSRTNEELHTLAFLRLQLVYVLGYVHRNCVQIFIRVTTLPSLYEITL